MCLFESVSQRYPSAILSASMSDGIWKELQNDAVFEIGACGIKRIILHDVVIADAPIPRSQGAVNPSLPVLSRSCELSSACPL